MFKAVDCPLTSFKWPPGMPSDAKISSSATLQSWAIQGGGYGLRATTSRAERVTGEGKLDETMMLGGSMHAVSMPGKELLKCIDDYTKAFLPAQHEQMLLSRHNLQQGGVVDEADSGDEGGYDSEDSDAGVADVSNPCPNFASYLAAMVALTILRFNGVNPTHGATHSTLAAPLPFATPVSPMTSQTARLCTPSPSRWGSAAASTSASAGCCRRHGSASPSTASLATMCTCCSRLRLRQVQRVELWMYLLWLYSLWQALLRRK